MAHALLLVCLLCLCLFGALLNQVRLHPPPAGAGATRFSRGLQGPPRASPGVCSLPAPKASGGPRGLTSCWQGSSTSFPPEKIHVAKSLCSLHLLHFCSDAVFWFFFHLKKEVSHAHPVLKITASVTSSDKKRCFRCGNPLLLR